MPGAATAEMIFIAAMMALILIVCFTAVYFFFKTYIREKRARAARTAAKTEKTPENGNEISDDLKSEI